MTAGGRHRCIYPLSFNYSLAVSNLDCYLITFQVAHSTVEQALSYLSVQTVWEQGGVAKEKLGEIREESMESMEEEGDEEGGEKDKLASTEENSVEKYDIEKTREKIVVNTSIVMIVNILERLDENSSHNI